jgi:CHASE3 domain sensor protein
MILLQGGSTTMSDKPDQTMVTHILDLTNKIDQLIESHKVLTACIDKIKEAIYNPDNGIYSRIRELEREVIKDGDIRIAKIEETLSGMKKLQWMVIGSGIAAIVSVIFKIFIMNE